MDITTHIDDLPTTFVDATLVRGGPNGDGHFETYGRDLAFIKAVAARWPDHVWTDLDGSDVSGVHHVNRLCYRISSRPVRDGFTVVATYRIECPACTGEEDEDDVCERCNGSGETYEFDASDLEGVGNAERAFDFGRSIDIEELHQLWLTIPEAQP